MKQAPTITDLPPKALGETDAAYNHRLASWLRGDDVRSKVDLREFKTADFHLDQSPMIRARPELCAKRGCYIKPKMLFPDWDALKIRCEDCPYPALSP